MSQQQGKGRHFSLRRGDKIILIALSIMALVLLVLTILRNNGLHLIHGEYYLFLPLVMILVVLGWGTWALFRRLVSRGARMAVALVGALVVMLLLNGAMNYISYIIAIGVPQYYSEFTSPDGAHTVVLMRMLDVSKERMDERREARLAAAAAAAEGATDEAAVESTSDEAAAAIQDAADAAVPDQAAGEPAQDNTAQISGQDTGTEATTDGAAPQEDAGAQTGDGEVSPDDYADTDFGYSYMLYPKGPMGLFFRANADVEGELYEALGGEGRLHLNWSEDGSSVRLYMSDPGPGEGGEWILRF